jgi:hypothetical protein
MARIRQVKPEFWTSLAIAELDRLTRLHFIALWNYVDDEGRGLDEPRLIKAACFPLDDDVDLEEVEHHQAVLAAAGRIVRYAVAGRAYFAVGGFGEHQYVQKKQTSRLPSPDDADPVADQTSTGDVPAGLGSGVGGQVSLAPAEPSPEESATDELDDAVLATCGIDPAETTDTAAAGYRKAVASIRRAGGTPDEVWVRARVFGKKFPNATLTPHALDKHWSQCARAGPPPPLRVVPENACPDCREHLPGQVPDPDGRGYRACPTCRPEAAHG